MGTGWLVGLLVGALAAGWVDAVVGGGGLILIPLLLIANPGMVPAQALATNKLAAVCGTTTSALVLQRRLPSARKALRYTPLAMAGAAAGALAASYLNVAFMRWGIIVLLLAVGVFVLLRPQFGAARSTGGAGGGAGAGAGGGGAGAGGAALASASKSSKPVKAAAASAPIRARTRAHAHTPMKAAAALITLALGLGFYDGIFGPGTGMFFIMAITAILGSDFVTSAAWAKVLNAATNLGALITFAVTGHVLWWLGLALAAANIAGGYLGAHTVLRAGTKFVRAVILVLVVVMVAKLAFAG